MITVPEVVSEIVKNKPFIAEAMSSSILNISGFAREIKDEVEEKTMKDVQIGSIIMALKRMQPDIKNRLGSQLIDKQPEIIVRSNLFEVTIKNSELTAHVQKDILQLASENTNQFTTITHGVFETTIIASNEVKKDVYIHLPQASIISEVQSLSSITINFHEDIIHTPGVYAHVLKQLAWNGISITEIVSTFSELTIIVENKDVSEAFSVISATFANK